MKSPEKLREKLPVLSFKDIDDNHEMITVKVDVKDFAFIKDGHLYLSGEREGSQAHICDYYGEFRGGYPWINPELEKWAELRGLFWEWENPACIFLCEV